MNRCKKCNAQISPAIAAETTRRIQGLYRHMLPDVAASYVRQDAPLCQACMDARDATELEQAITFFEQHVLGRSLTSQGRVEFSKSWSEVRDPPGVFRELSERLQTRQGTTMPDFDALYKRKAQLDHDRP